MKKITGDVNLNNLYLREIPSILNDVSIEGILNIADNRIKNLNNFPLECDSVDLSDNPLTSLVGIKQKYIRDLEASRTKIQNLEGCPEIVSQLLIKNCASFKLGQKSLSVAIDHEGTIYAGHTTGHESIIWV